MTRFLFLMMFMLFTTPAFADDVPTASTVSESVEALLRDVLFPVMAAFLLGMVSLLVKKIATKYNVEISEKNRERIERLALQGIAYAEEKAATAIKKKSPKWDKNDKLNAAVSHMIAVVPKLSDKEAKFIVESMLARVSGVGATGDKAIK